MSAASVFDTSVFSADSAASVYVTFLGGLDAHRGRRGDHRDRETTNSTFSTPVSRLDACGLLDDSLVDPGDPLGEEPMPLGVGESDPVQRLQLQPQVRGQICLRPDWQVLVRLLLQLPDERRFEFGLGLVRRGRDPVRNELGDDGALGTDRDQVERPGVPAQPRVGLGTGMTVTTSSRPT